MEWLSDEAHYPCTVVRGGDKTYWSILLDWYCLVLLDNFWMNNDRIIAWNNFSSLIFVSFDDVKNWKLPDFLNFGRKWTLLKILGMTFILYYRLLSIYKKRPNFHSFLSFGTVLSPPPLITWPLCPGRNPKKID